MFVCHITMELYYGQATKRQPWKLDCQQLFVWIKNLTFLQKSHILHNFICLYAQLFCTYLATFCLLSFHRNYFYRCTLLGTFHILITIWYILLKVTFSGKSSFSAKHSTRESRSVKKRGKLFPFDIEFATLSTMWNLLCVQVQKSL